MLNNKGLDNHNDMRSDAHTHADAHSHTDCGGECSACAHSCFGDTAVKATLSAPVSVQAMAARREARAKRQAELISQFGAPIVCFTMNIAGEIKYNPAVELCFYTGCDELFAAAANYNAHITHAEYHVAETGCEAFFAFGGIRPPLLKAIATRVEDETGFGRLFDIDVFDAEGKKLSRRQPRKCLICDEDAVVCARSRAHTVDELRATTRLLTLEAAAYAASRAAYGALVDEVRTTPKAGLVDLNNSGANSDMTVETFMKGARALAPFYYSMAHAASTFPHGSPELTDTLVMIGREAESAMLEATGGINTHKGAIFCVGLLCAAVGSVMAQGEAATVTTVINEATRLANNRALPTDATNGSAVRSRFAEGKPMGADAEAREGFPHVLTAYRCIMGFRLMGLSDNDAYALALLRIMATLRDTNAYKRGGEEGAEFVRSRAAEILEIPLPKRIDAVIEFDKELIDRNVNCGGAADLLAAAIFLDRLSALTEART